jgi:hypothetical protein
MPKTQVFGEAALVPIMAAALIETDLAAVDMSVPSQELPVNLESEKPVTYEEEVLSSTGHEIPEVNVPITVEVEPELRSTNSTSEDKEVSTVEMEEQHVMVAPESRDAANIEWNNDIIPLAAAEPGPEIVAGVVLGTFELQAQHSVEETTEVSFTLHSFSRISLINCNKIIKEVHIVEAASETEFIVPDEGLLGSAMEVLPTNSQLELTVKPVKVQLEIPEAGESDHTAEVEPQIIMEESPAEIEEDRPVLAVLQVRQLLSSAYLLTLNPKGRHYPV